MKRSPLFFRGELFYLFQSSRLAMSRGGFYPTRQPRYLSFYRDLDLALTFQRRGARLAIEMIVSVHALERR